ncbi:MAG: 23S rRNA (uracil(1939)-C(5))-methyltransferase RlmD [Parachlamydiaceae bacterium]|nr:23S rRNA (uracil(1939)-C(5))-methyltransferase RlmD [Parachlamydiaceae bacterium]
MSLPEINQIIQLTIEDFGSHGEGVGHLDGYTIFVEGVLPGEVIEGRLIQRQKKFGRATLINLIKPSPDRQKPICQLFGKCGGCQLMHLTYQKQLHMKQQKVIDALQRIGKINDVDVPVCLPSPKSLAYRNKIQLPVRNGRTGLALGMYAHASHELVELDSCHIHCSMGDEIFAEVNALIKKSTICAYDPVTGKGELRHLLIKSAIYTQQALVILVTNVIKPEKMTSLAEQIMLRCPQVKGVVQNINKQNSNTILSNTYQVLAGSDHIQEMLGELRFKISPASFFQVNPEQAVLLYSKAVEFANLDGTEIVLDAYCGVGTLSLFFAKHAKKVLGVECVSDAIVDAKENAALNGIKNVSFVCKLSEDYIASLSAVDVVVLNPPRKGCEPSVLQELKRLRPKTIVYISCDPSTLARDLAILREYGFAIEAIQPFDMFPQTAHVECVVKLKS